MTLWRSVYRAALFRRSSLRAQRLRYDALPEQAYGARSSLRCMQDPLVRFQARVDVDRAFREVLAIAFTGPASWLAGYVAEPGAMRIAGNRLHVAG